ncbi:flagellar associated protein [Angomonas deanei]|uniref:p25-alpha, putative n=1 Tax=Angomonas deanei TaxID=59799 RepID=S9U5B6_9TRYP|nr:flagellar associated protein [Angomonas deanei]EPY39974.1 flagellar associated protein [Angomonas deanei]CAD2215031.1 p25-alpha, putative [Angomonas deanei]|eukprot:EPY25997.1 flagellar associated protein [Angomonas deanei]
MTLTFPFLPLFFLERFSCFHYIPPNPHSQMSELQKAFEAFASFGSAPSKEMDNSHFSKMLKECKIIGKVFTSTDADMLFTKIKAKGARKITFTEFKTKGIPEIATKLKKTNDEVEEMISSASPEAHGTKADNVKFHDDKSLYTGVAKEGGPTNVDRNAGSLAGVVDRRVSTTDNRGTTTKQV